MRHANVQYHHTTQNAPLRWYYWEGIRPQYGHCGDPRTVSGKIEATSPESAKARLEAQFTTVAYIQECQSPQPVAGIILAFILQWGVFGATAGSAFAALAATPDLAVAAMVVCWVITMAFGAATVRAKKLQAHKIEVESGIAAARAEIAATRKRLAATAAELEAEVTLAADDPKFAASLGANEEWLRKMTELQAELNKPEQAPAATAATA